MGEMKRKKTAAFTALVLALGLISVQTNVTVAEAKTKGYTVSKDSGTYTETVRKDQNIYHEKYDDPSIDRSEEPDKGYEKQVE